MGCRGGEVHDTKIDCAVASTDTLQSVVLHSMPQSVASGFLQLRYEKPRHYVMETNHNYLTTNTTKISYPFCSNVTSQNSKKNWHVTANGKIKTVVATTTTTALLLLLQLYYCFILISQSLFFTVFLQFFMNLCSNCDS